MRFGGVQMILLGLAACLVLPSHLRAQPLFSSDFEGELGEVWQGAVRSIGTIGEGWHLTADDIGVVRLGLPKEAQESLVRVRFDLLILGSWDGLATQSQRGMIVGPDLFWVTEGTGRSLFQASFSNVPEGEENNNPNSDRQSHPGLLPGDQFASRTGASGSNGESAIYPITLLFLHKGPMLNLQFSSRTSGQDERWGIDNLIIERVEANDLPADSLQKLWEQAIATDAPQAQGAFWDLIAAGQPAREFIESERTRNMISEEAFAKLVEDLNDPDFNTRQQATQRLAGLKLFLKEQIEQALTRPHPPETRKRLAQVLETDDDAPVNDPVARRQQIARRAMQLLDAEVP